MIELDADRLNMLQALGEQFDTGKPTRMWAVFDNGYVDAGLEQFRVADRETHLLCRESDVKAHELAKKTRVTRVSTGVSYSVRDLEADGTGMTLVRLSA